MLVLLTGDRGCGKTTACCRLAELADRHNLALGGITAPARYDHDGIKIGIMMRDLTNKQERLLAQVVAINSASITVGHYAFDDQVTAWGLDCILQALDNPLDAVIIDEIGPLELNQGAGFAPALDRLATMQARSAILIVRPSLVDDLRLRLAALSPQIVRLDHTNRDSVPQRLLEILGA